MKFAILVMAAILTLSGCASVVNIPEPEMPVLVRNTNTEFNNLPAPATGKLVAAVYGFTDKTGQRKPSDKMANISTAVTQGSEVWLIKALQEVGGGEWFQVVERVGLDNLTKERQIIRQARESVGDERVLKPMLFAGVIIEGGIIGYDSNVESGGEGARYFGIGVHEEYRVDQVTVSMRLVAVQTGEILLTAEATKTIASHRAGADVFRFLDMSTKAFEIETGVATNEPINYAIRTAIEYCLYEIIKSGENLGMWKFKYDVHKGM